ncbi:hypothetical protein V1605_18570 [Enterobacter soli]|uniref:hypothetical protein n=1 Tax=Enterobacter soli TaxID=885040 RepID=UPI0037540F78
MTAEQENASRATARRCNEELKAAMRQRPKPNWNNVVPPILRKYHEILKPLGISLIKFNSEIGRLNGRFGAEQ